MTTYEYRGYVIDPLPRQLQDSEKWTTNIHIEHYVGSEVRVHPYHAADTFDTKKEAIEACVEFGRQIIDGKIPNCTVEDL